MRDKLEHDAAVKGFVFGIAVTLLFALGFYCAVTSITLFNQTAPDRWFFLIVAALAFTGCYRLTTNITRR